MCRAAETPHRPRPRGVPWPGPVCSSSSGSGTKKVKNFPAFDSLWLHYPAGKTAQEVKAMIGGLVNSSWIRNTCAIRMSHALNYSGQPIPKGRLLKNGRFLSTVTGADKLQYAYRLAELKQFLIEEYGPPTRSETAETVGTANVPKEPFLGQRGVIVFDVRDFGDSTGHIDLWDGADAKEHAYFASAHRVCLWRCD